MIRRIERSGFEEEKMYGVNLRISEELSGAGFEEEKMYGVSSDLRRIERKRILPEP
jgi:hypothetical protein